MASQPSTPRANWFKIIRPQTLFASFCPVAVGWLVGHDLLAQTDNRMHLVAGITLICALALQVLSNLINDYYDYRRGADSKGRVGFKRALAEGLVTERQMLTACFIALGVAVITGVVLWYVGGWVILVIGLTAILFAWLYTATDYSLSYLGIADIFVFLYYGVVATGGTVYLLYRAIGIEIDPQALRMAVYAGAVNGLISMCVLAINNIRDIDTDRAVGKRTLPVRIGKTGALAALGVVVALMPVCAWMAFGLSLPVLVIVPAAILYGCVLRAQGATYNYCLLGAGVVNLCYVILVALHI